MGVYKDIEAALNTRLNSLALHPPIAWPNTQFKPILKQTYLRPTLLPASTQTMTLQRKQWHTGIYQIDIFASLDKGIAEVLKWMDEIEEHFSSELSLVSGSSIVHLKQSGRSQFNREENWFSGYIEINYICIT